MKQVSKVVRTLVSGLWLALAACGGSQNAAVRPDAMPAGGDFTGVWHSPQYGEMHLEQQAGIVRGRYAIDERTGKIRGEVQGNLLSFEWIEKRAMIANRPRETRGEGYFRYLVDPANGDHVLKGRWWLGDDRDNGGEWNAYKLRNREPELEPAPGEPGKSGLGVSNEVF